jgi:very-short-patch-repair endonuclease
MPGRHHEEMGEADRIVIERAISNGGIITRSEAVALGMSGRTVKRRVADGQFVALGHGVLGMPAVFEHEETALRAADAAIGAIASHESASRLHAIEGLDPLRWTVSVPIRRSNRFASLKVHQLTDLDFDQCTEIRGIPVTDPIRTVIDLAAVLPKRRLSDVVDQTVRKGLATYPMIGVRLENLARKGKPGVVKLRSVLEARSGVAISPESTLETKVLDLLARGGLPLAATQFRPAWLRSVDGRVDLAYIDARVIVEADSRRWHDSPEAFQADRRRDNLAQLAGWTILRFTWEDIVKRPSYVIGTVETALARFSAPEGPNVALHT